MRGKCIKCEREFALNLDGTLRNHKLHLAFDRPIRCTGSGMEPSGALVRAEAESFAHVCDSGTLAKLGRAVREHTEKHRGQFGHTDPEKCARTCFGELRTELNIDFVGSAPQIDSRWAREVYKQVLKIAVGCL